MTTVTTEYNKALNGLHFIGTNNGNVDVNNFKHSRNVDVTPILTHTLILK